MKKTKISCEIITKNFQINLNGKNNVGKKTYLEIKINEDTIQLPIEKLKKRKTKIFSNINIEKNKIIKTILINNEKYFIFSDEFSDVFISKFINTYLRVRQRFIGFILFKNLFFFGVFSNISNRIENFNSVFLNNVKITEVMRPINFGIFKHIAFIKIKLSDIVASTQVHNRVAVGKKGLSILPIKYLKRNMKKPIHYYIRRKYQDKIIIVRSTIKDRTVVVTKIEQAKEYSFINKSKIYLAYILSVISKKLPRRKNINLFFEKESRQAQESGYYVFEKVMEYTKNNKNNSKNYFILDKKANIFKEIKEKYKNNIVKKYSLKHYYLIFISNYFLASELPNHVLNPRLYISIINNVIKNKPLIFLQHGIMFAKPVDNPAAKGFYKDNPSANIFKSIISSELEATQFYKMGYNRDDLIKCGLPKFDVSKMNKKSKKIMFMPTYRFWEESEINDPKRIQNTTYWKLFIKVIKAFEKENLLNQLIISAHPKFSQKIAESMPEYSHLIETDINKGLENARIFITDYSSASYDAHYRGANIIYYWEERDYLIENYQATPPINETNCDGVPVFSVDELIKEIKKIKKRKYQNLPIYEERYKKINEFSDNKNTERLLNELSKLNII